MNQILLFDADFVDSHRILLEDHRATHIKEVLKSKSGQQIKVGLLGKGIGLAEVISCEKKTTELKIISLSKTPPLSSFSNITLLLALPRPQTLKKVLETAATFGVGNIMLIGTERVEKSFFQSSLFKDEAYKEYLFLGLQQGGYTTPPKVTVHKSQKYWDEIEMIKTRYIAHPESKGTFLNHFNKEKSPMVIAIGPEGGWLDDEVVHFESKGFFKITLGKTIHRVENAVCAALSQIELLKENA